MPFLTVFVAATEVSHSVNTAHLEEWDAHHRESWIQSDVEAAVAIKQCRILAVFLQIFLVSKEHRNSCAVLAGKENLLGCVILRIEIDLRCTEHLRCVRLDIIFINRRRECERGESIENLRLFVATNNACRAECRELNLMLQSAV